MRVSVHSNSGPTEWKERWDRYVRSAPCSVCFHLWGWYRAIERTYRHRVFFLMAERNGNVAGVLPLVLIRSLRGASLISAPFSPYAGICSDDDVAQRGLLSSAKELMRRVGADVTVLRQVGRRVSSLPAEAGKVTMVLPLEASADQQWRAFHPKVRNQIRKGERCGLVSSVGGQEQLDRFYSIYARNMRDLGTPVHRKRLFSEILKEFSGSAKVFLVHLDGTPVAAALAVRFRKSSQVLWGSSVREFNKLCPNNVLYWSMLRDAIRVGQSVFEFGRSTVGSGTYRFKKQWGCEDVPLYYQWISHKSDRGGSRYLPFGGESAAVKMWKRLPLCVANNLGPMIRGFIP